MNVVTWLVAGGLVGRAASYYMGTPQLPAIAFNIGVGVVGAAIGGWLLGPALGLANEFGVFAVIVSAVGSTLLLLAVHLAQRGRPEHPAFNFKGK